MLISVPHQQGNDNAHHQSQPMMYNPASHAPSEVTPIGHAHSDHRRSIASTTSGSVLTEEEEEEEGPGEGGDVSNAAQQNFSYFDNIQHTQVIFRPKNLRSK